MPKKLGVRAVTSRSDPSPSKKKKNILLAKSQRKPRSKITLTKCGRKKDIVERIGGVKVEGASGKDQ